MIESYSNAFRKLAKLGNKLTGIIDFDGIISSYSARAAGLTPGGGFPVVRLFQTSDAKEQPETGLEPLELLQG